MATKIFEELRAIMHRLRNECPWDREQTLQTLRTYILEEAYECVDAIDHLEEGDDALIEEIGDVFLQVLFQSEILSERRSTDALEEIMRGLRDKLVRRHPHVFGDQKESDPERALARWNSMKEQEQKKSSSLLKDLPKALPALTTSLKIGKRCADIKFDWETPEQVWNQVDSELQELAEAKTEKELEHELGDVFFSLVQWARHKNLDPEVCLAQANQRFRSRFHSMEKIASDRQQDFKKLSLEEKEKLWKLAKQSEKH